MSLLHVRKSCVLCGSYGPEPVMELPATPPANEFVKERGVQDKFPLSLQLCGECGHLQLAEVVDPKRLFGQYVYVSGTSPVFVRHFEELAKKTWEMADLGPSSFVIDIGSNDGTLLKAFKGLGVGRVLGIDPAESIASKATSEGVPTLSSFFTRACALRVRDEHGPADLITANNVFAHADDLEEIAIGVSDLLGPDGVFVFEVSYLQDVVKGMLFDTIYHEHLSYHTLRPLIGFFDELGMSVFHAERVGTHGGSLRVYVSRARRMPSDDVGRLASEELGMGLFEPRTYSNFHDRIMAQGRKLREQIAGWKLEGKRIAGYGAPAKLTTLMHAFDLRGEDFEFIIDDSPWKQGLYTPGKNVLVKPSFTMYEQRKELMLNEEKIDVCVVFAWNFFDSIVAKNSDWKGLFINPLA